VLFGITMVKVGVDHHKTNGDIVYSISGELAGAPFDVKYTDPTGVKHVETVATLPWSKNVGASSHLSRFLQIWVKPSEYSNFTSLSCSLSIGGETYNEGRASGPLAEAYCATGMLTGV
jgi:hypothetical protein